MYEKIPRKTGVFLIEGTGIAIFKPLPLKILGECFFTVKEKNCQIKKKIIFDRFFENFVVFMC